MLAINRIKNLKTNSKLLLLASVILVSVSVISFVQSASFEIADQPEPTVSNTTVTPGTEDRGNSVVISSKVIDVSGVTYVKTQIKDSSNIIVASIDLYDDGAHNDGAAGDNIYGNSWTIPISFSAGNYKIFIITVNKKNLNLFDVFLNYLQFLDIISYKSNFLTFFR